MLHYTRNIQCTRLLGSHFHECDGQKHDIDWQAPIEFGSNKPIGCSFDCHSFGKHWQCEIDSVITFQSPLLSSIDWFTCIGSFIHTANKQTNNSFVKCFAVKIIMRIKQPFERRLFVISILSFSLTRKPNTILFHLILLGNFDLYAPLVRQTRWFCNRIRLSQSEMKKCCSFFRSRIRTKAVIRKQGKLMATTSFDDDKPVREIKGWKYMKWKKYSSIWRADEWDFDVLMGTGMTWRNVTNEIEQVDFL